MNWKLSLHRARRAFTRNYTDDFKRSAQLVGYDTAARISAYQEALVLGLTKIEYHDAGIRRDGKVVREADWKGIK